MSSSVARPAHMIRAVVAAFLAAALGALILGGSPAYAVTFTVTKAADTNDGACNADCSLREAVIAANAAPGADTITLPAGMYTLTIAGKGEDASVTGDLDITDSLTIIGAGSAETIVSTAVPDRIFHVYGGGVIAYMSGVTVSGGQAEDTGGGIRNRFSSRTLEDVTVTGSTAGVGAGGGIWNDGNLTLISSTVSGNWTLGIGNDGGGIYNNGEMALDGSIISGNTSTRQGGGIANRSATLTLNESIVSGNVANDSGGGIANASATLTLNESAVSGNTASVFGGGIVSNGVLTLNGTTVSGNNSGHGAGGIFANGVLTLNGTTVSGNTAADYGGGIDNNGRATVISSTVSGNTSAGWGGGLHNDVGGELTLTNSTVSGNMSVLNGGGIYHRGSTTTLKNTIVADNVGNNCYWEQIEIASDGYNLDSDGTCGLSALGDTSGVDPLLDGLGDNGGPTKTHALLAGSPAIDAGSPDCPPPATDQRGVARPQDGDGNGSRICDIGAYERDLDSDDDGFPDSSDPCPTQAEDVDGFQDSDGCPEPDNDLDGICDAGQTSPSCSGADSGRQCFDPAGTLTCVTIDCRNVAEDLDAFKDSDGCPEPDNDNDGFPDAIDSCPGTDAHAGPDGMLGSPQDLNHNGVKDPSEAVFTTDDSVLVFEDYDGVLDTDGCHDSPGDDFDGDGFTDDNEALFIGTDPGYPCGNGGWPADLWSVGVSANKLALQDVTSFVTPVYRFNTNPTDANFDPRWDLSPGTGGLATYINLLDITSLVTATSTGYPPMLGGVKAFNGPACPYPAQ